LFATLLLVYASLVPLQWTPQPWDVTLVAWQNIPWLDLGVFNRADWIANALVVMPPAFLTIGWLDTRSKSPYAVLLWAPFVVLEFVALVLAIELLQVWFPPRTVSQNDIIAGWIGSVLGVLAWLIAGRWLVRLVERFGQLEHITDRLHWVSLAAMALCLAYSVYPLDLVLSQEELRYKWEAGRIQLALSFHAMFTLEVLKGISLSLLRAFPFGVWFGLRGNKRLPLLEIVALAVALELIQIPVFSKYVSCWEMGGGVLGGVVGFLAVRWYPLWGLLLRQPGLWLTGAVFWTGLIVVALNGRFAGIIHSTELIRERWAGFFTPPLLRYYYSSEYAALSNIAGKAGLFAVLGFLVAGTAWSGTGRVSARPFWIGFAISAAVGLVLEVAQVYMSPLIADASDVAIYVAGYGLGYFAAYAVLGGHPASTLDSSKAHG
jgi:VanZ family protein